MAIYKTTGIVIGRHNFGEADRVMVLLTPERGVVRAVAKGVRRIKSKLAGHLELFCESELMLVEGRNLDVVTSARLKRHSNMTDNYDKMRLAYLVAEMTNRLAGEDEHPGLFELIHDTLTALDTTPSDTTLELWFKLRLLDRLGYRPELNRCIICHTNDPGRQYRLNVELGGIVDEGCASVASLPMSKENIKLWRLMLDHPLESVRRVSGVLQASQATMSLANQFYDHTFGQRFRSAEVLT